MAIKMVITLPETDHTQRRRFCNGAIRRTMKALTILGCLYGSEIVSTIRGGH